MFVVELQGDKAITAEESFDYGSSGRGGWDETPAGLVSRGKRTTQKRLARNAGFYLSRAEVQGRRPSELKEVGKMSVLPRQRGGVYLMMNTMTRDFYIGSSYQIQGRWKSHIWQMRKRKHPLARVNALVREFGVECWRFILLQDGLTDIFGAKRLTAEKNWIKRLKPTLNRVQRMDGRKRRWLYPDELLKA